MSWSAKVFLLSSYTPHFLFFRSEADLLISYFIIYKNKLFDSVDLRLSSKNLLWFFFSMQSCFFRPVSPSIEKVVNDWDTFTPSNWMWPILEVHE